MRRRMDPHEREATAFGSDPVRVPVQEPRGEGPHVPDLDIAIDWIAAVLLRVIQIVVWASRSPRGDQRRRPSDHQDMDLQHSSTRAFAHIEGLPYPTSFCFNYNFP